MNAARVHNQCWMTQERQLSHNFDDAVLLGFPSMNCINLVKWSNNGYADSSRIIVFHHSGK